MSIGYYTCLGPRKVLRSFAGAALPPPWVVQSFEHPMDSEFYAFSLHEP